MDYVADDVVEISRRMKEIQRTEATIPPEVHTASGEELNKIAATVDLWREIAEGDYAFRNRVIEEIRKRAVQ